MGAGRPTDYKPEYDDLAYKFCLLGATDAQLGEFFGVTEQTINGWKTKHPKFFESIKRGKELADAKVAEALYNKACGFVNKNAVKIFMPANAQSPVYAPYEEYYPPDTAAAFIWLKNRAGWKDRQEINHSGKIETSEDAIDKRIKELEEKLRADIK